MACSTGRFRPVKIELSGGPYCGHSQAVDEFTTQGLLDGVALGFDLDPRRGLAAYRYSHDVTRGGAVRLILRFVPDMTEDSNA